MIMIKNLYENSSFYLTKGKMLLLRIEDLSQTAKSTGLVLKSQDLAKQGKEQEEGRHWSVELWTGSRGSRVCNHWDNIHTFTWVELGIPSVLAFLCCLQIEQNLLQRCDSPPSAGQSLTMQLVQVDSGLCWGATISNPSDKRSNQYTSVWQNLFSLLAFLKIREVASKNPLQEVFR